MVRAFCIAEKQRRLYPVHSKVVQRSTKTFYETTRDYLEKAKEGLQLKISKTSMLVDEAPVYSEDNASVSLAHLLFEAGIRSLTILEEVTNEELEKFLVCFKETVEADDEDDDFGTVFWEKDCTNIQLQLIDDAEESSEDIVVTIPKGHLFTMGFDPKRFDLTAEDEARLKKELTDRVGNEDDGNSAFEFGEEELSKLNELAASEESYFAIYDFVDVIIEHVAGGNDEDAFDNATRMVRDVTFALIENFDFEHATDLLTKMSVNPHPALTTEQRAKMREISSTFSDKQTMTLVGEFLKETGHLPRTHAVFTFMKTLGRSILKDVCEFLDYKGQLKGLTEVLVHVGKGSSQTLAKQMMSSNEEVANAMIQVLIETDRDGKNMERIARALEHQSESVRRTAARTILEHGDEKVGAYFLPLLSDPPLLSVALQFYAKVSYPNAYEPLSKMILGPAFHFLEQSRQILCFRALNLADPEKSLAFISQSILRWSRSMNQKSRKRKVAALRGLVEHPHEGATAILVRFSAMSEKIPLSGVAKQAQRLRQKWLKENAAKKKAKAKTQPASKAPVQPGAVQPGAVQPGAVQPEAVQPVAEKPAAPTTTPSEEKKEVVSVQQS